MGDERKQGSVINIMGIVLAFATLIVTAINGIPAYLSIKGKEPYVVYDVNQAQMLYPSDADKTSIRDLLTEKGIPDTFSTLTLSNRGDLAAKEVIATVAIPGKFIAETTDPDPDSRPAWVTITREYIPPKNPSRIRFTLKNLGLGKSLTIKISYISQVASDPTWEVFSDGKPAIMVPDIRSVPENAREISFVPTIRVFAYSTLVSLVVFLLFKQREKRVSGSKKYSAADRSNDWRKYKDQILILLSSKPDFIIESATEGSIDANKPVDFWDGIFALHSSRVAIEVHTASQSWDGLVGSEAEQNSYSLKILAMARNNSLPINIVVLVNDEDIWGSKASNVCKILEGAANNIPDLRFVFLSGEPSEVANKLVASLSHA